MLFEVLQLVHVQGAPERRGGMAPMQNVTFEMNKEEINAMLQV